MSTILKALRRLEQERQQVTPRALREEVVLSRSRARTRPTWIAALVAVALLGFAGTWAALGRWRAASPEATAPASAALRVAPPAHPAASLPPSVATPPPPAASTAPAAAAAPPDVAIAAPGTTPATPPAPAAAGLPAADRAPASASGSDELLVRPMPRHRPRLLVEEDEAPAPPPQSGSEPPFAMHSAEPAAPAPPLSAAPGARPPSAVPDAEPAVPPAVATAAAAPFPLRVVRTSWHPHPDRRTAWVDVGGEAPRAVHEGDTVGRFVVREIEPDGVVFVDGSVEIRRAVGAR
jgi:hypothetical protein